MIAEINRIYQVLPTNTAINFDGDYDGRLDEKTDLIREWMESVLDKIDHYKAEHADMSRRE